MTSFKLFCPQRLAHNLERARRMEGGRHFLQGRFLYEAGASSLMDRLSLIKRPMGRLLVLGCGIGDDIIGAALPPTAYDVTFLDPFYSPKSLGRAVWQTDGTLPPFDQGYDGVIGFFGLSVTENVPVLLRSIYECLKPDRPFLGVFLGGDSLMDLRLTLHDVESDLYGGVFPRIHPMMAAGDGFHLLEKAGFSLPIVDTTKIMACYPTLSALVSDLRFHGMTNSLSGRLPPPLSRFFCSEVQRRYPKQPYSEGLEVTYDLVFLNGWRP